MTFILILGPPAVGKMTVGVELEKITGLRLFTNHMTIELVSRFFPYQTLEGQRLVHLFRREIFEAVAKSHLDGIIFTFAWDFDVQFSFDYMDEVCGIFEAVGADIIFVELEADYGVRLRRHESPERRVCKPSVAERELLPDWMRRHNSLPGEITREKYIRIDNTDLPPDKVALMIKERMGIG
jgi:hypothetical protein